MEVIILDQRPFPVEPMSSGKVFSRSVSTYLKNFKYFAIFTLLFSGILTLASFISNEIYRVSIDLDLTELIGRLRNQDFSSLYDMVRGIDQLRARAVTPVQLGLLTFVASLFISPLVYGGIADITVGYFLGESLTPKERFKRVASHYKSLFITNICTFLIFIAFIIALVTVFSSVALLMTLIMVGLSVFTGLLLLFAAAVFLIIVIIFWSSVMTVTFAIVVREDMTGFRPFFRALRLCFSRFWRTVGINLLVSLVTSLCTLAVTLLFGIVLNIFNVDGIVERILGQVVVPLLLNPLLHIALSLHYVSLRIEMEGYLQTPFYATYTGYYQSLGADTGSGADVRTETDANAGTDGINENEKAPDDNNGNDSDDDQH